MFNLFLAREYTGTSHKDWKGTQHEFNKYSNQTPKNFKNQRGVN